MFLEATYQLEQQQAEHCKGERTSQVQPHRRIRIKPITLSIVGYSGGSGGGKACTSRSFAPYSPSTLEGTSPLKNSLGALCPPKLETEHNQFGTFRARFVVVLGLVPTFSTGRDVPRSTFAGSCITSPHWPTNRRRTLAHAGAPNPNV
jgi:hypothetical protein